MTEEQTAAEQLEGRIIGGEWEVIEQITLPDEHTGGHFSVGYRVRSSDGQEGYLKALDFSAAMRAGDPARALQALTEAFNFERDVLHACRERGFDRIVVPLADGRVQVEDASPPTVQYLVFRLADQDLRTRLIQEPPEHLATVFGILHHCAVGIRQLHSAEIAHQDLKPSNVLKFEGEGHKLADLGRASYRGYTPPHERVTIAGDKSYAPPELLYNHVPSDWGKRRRACDLYLLGSLAVSIFRGVNMTALLRMELHDEHDWIRWRGPFKDVLPYVRSAFNNSLRKVGSEISGWAREETMQTVRYLCEPNPDRRGHPRNHVGNRDPYSLERFVSKFNLLANRAQVYGS